MKSRGTGAWGNHLLVSLYLLRRETPGKATGCSMLDYLILLKGMCVFNLIIGSNLYNRVIYKWYWFQIGIILSSFRIDHEAS